MQQSALAQNVTCLTSDALHHCRPDPRVSGRRRVGGQLCDANTAGAWTAVDPEIRGDLLGGARLKAAYTSSNGQPKGCEL